MQPLALACLLLATASVVVASARFPLYHQCDPKWGSDMMGVNGHGERATVCKEGCAMSCVAMALAGVGVDVDGKVATPGTLNAWLEAHGGYECLDGDCNNLKLPVIDTLSRGRVTFVSEADKPSADDLRTGLEATSAVYIAHVHHNSHFVLLTSYNDTTGEFNALDPYYPSTAYPYANISDVIIYNVAKELRARAPPADALAAMPKYPLFKQCDPRWGSDLIDTETLCQVGCLESSVSMALAGHMISVPAPSFLRAGNPATVNTQPGVLNAWLRANGGYEGNDLVESAVAKLSPHVQWPADGMHTSNNIPYGDLGGYLAEGRPVIANVLNGTHFVLVTALDKDGDTLYINDPGFQRSTYSYTTVVGWRLFNMTMAA